MIATTLQPALMLSQEAEALIRQIIDSYLLGERFRCGRRCKEILYALGVSTSRSAWEPSPYRYYRADQRLVMLAIQRLKESRYAPFVAKAQLAGELELLSEAELRQRILRLRCYLAEPDEPSDELLKRLETVLELYTLLAQFRARAIDALQLERRLRPLQAEIADHAPELHPLLYVLAEQMSFVGEHSPEDPKQLQRELRAQTAQWQRRLQHYWHAVLG